MGATIFAAVAVGIGMSHLGIREFVILLLSIIAVFVFLIPARQILQVGFLLWICTFGFGWRTLYLTPSLTIHPAEVLVYLLFVVLALHTIAQRSSFKLLVPLPVLLFVVWGVIGIGIAVTRGNPIDVVLSEFKVFLVAVPTYHVVSHLVRNRRDWERAIFLSIWVAVYVGMLGVMDLIAPDLSRQLVSETATTVSVAYETGFARAAFLFFGHPAAGFVIFAFFGVTVYQLLAPHSHKLTILLWGGALVIQVLGMYVSGYRGLWYSAGIFLIIYAFFKNRLWALAGVGLLAIPFLPVEFVRRFESLYRLEFADSSQFKRLERAGDAFELLKNNLFTGVGWGGSGYVHSDLLQIATNLGLLGLLLFLLWLILHIWQMFRLSRRPGWSGEYAAVLFATFCALGVVWAGEGLIVWTQMMMPIWFLFAMADQLNRLSSSEQVPQPSG
jgi:hypothetical protein